MKVITKYELFKESKEYSNKNLITEICVLMVLINNEFLDNILDKNLKIRYSQNSQIFLTDLKNLLLNKNRLSLGRFVDDKCVVDDELSKANSAFESIEFNIEKDWNKLIDARNTARNIIDKLLPEKLTPDLISHVFWLGPNKDDLHKEDIVIELKSGKQYSFYLNKSMQTQKTSAFNTFAESFMINIDNLYDEENLRKWDKLTQEFVRITYENATKQVQKHIEKFIDAKRIDSIGYYEYFNLRHRDPRFKHLGEYMREFEKNVLMFSDLMNLIWKNDSFEDNERANNEWSEVKTVVLNSRILERLFTQSIVNTRLDEIKKTDGNFKIALKSVKMKLVKILVEKLGCLERDVYFLSKNGNEFYTLPSKKFFRKTYDDLEVLFDYHVKFMPDFESDPDNKNFNMFIKVNLDGAELLNFNIIVGFTGGIFSSKLNAKYKFNIPPNFNSMIQEAEEF